MTTQRRETITWAGQPQPAGSAIRSRWNEDAVLAELELAWANGGYRAFSADDGTWCVVSSADEVLTGHTPDALDRAIRTHWQAMQ